MGERGTCVVVVGTEAARDQGHIDLVTLGFQEIQVSVSEVFIRLLSDRISKSRSLYETSYKRLKLNHLVDLRLKFFKNAV